MNYPIVINHATTRYGQPRGVTGRDGARPSGICISFTGMDMENYVQFVGAGLTEPALRKRLVDRPAACHFLVGSDAQIIELIDPKNMSWGMMTVKAPKFKFSADTNPNINAHLIYIGIAGSQLTKAAKGALLALIAELAKRYSIEIDHSHVIPPSFINSDVEDDEIPNEWVSGAYAIVLGEPELMTLDQRMAAIEERLLVIEG